MQTRIYSCSPSIGSAAVAVFCWYDKGSRKSLREPVGRIIRNEFRDGQQVNNFLSDRSLSRAYETNDAASIPIKLKSHSTDSTAG